jgi:serine/threonine protein kinase
MTFQDETFIYFLFEYICGGELFSFLRQQIRFSVDSVKFYACQMVLAIEFLHGKDIVYRDIKPENILIDRKGNLKLTDFGFAKVLTGKTYTMCGTPEYMAPEVIMKGDGYDFLADWWSLGIFLFEMVEGKPPFFDEHPIQIYQKILIGKFNFFHCGSRKLKGLIKKLLVESGKRLGRKNGGKDIKNHGFFDKVGWNDVLSKIIPAPWVPAVESRDDTQYFNEYCDTDDGAPSVAGSTDLNVVFQGF